jgi:hypothetical protein
MSSASVNISSRWNVDFLKAKSLKTDPFAESIIKEVAKNQDFSSLRELFKALDTNDDIANNKNLPPIVNDYFKDNDELPAWADFKKIKIAQEVFKENGPEIALILNYKALPLCYACKNGAKVLATTGRLTSVGNDTSKMMRRLLETSQMVINVMTEGGLSPKGKGIITVKKVRLYHAAIRFFLLNSNSNNYKWDTQHYGLPINQEEMAGTLMAFSALVLNGLTQLGIELTKEQKDAYMHCWNIVGHYIGLEPDLYPNDFEDGWNLGIEIIKRNQEESADGKFLIDSLILNSKSYFFKGEIMDFIPAYLIKFFVEDVSKTINVDLNKVLGLEEHFNLFEKIGGKLFLESFDLVDGIEDHAPVIKKIVEKFSTKHLQELVNHYLKVNNVAFYIPGNLKENWKLN